MDAAQKEARLDLRLGKIAVESGFISPEHVLRCLDLQREEVKQGKAPRPLLLIAPTWRGVSKAAIETAQLLAPEGYVVFVADMFGEGNGPIGTEDPGEFLRPFLADTAGMRRRVHKDHYIERIAVVSESRRDETEIEVHRLPPPQIR